MMGVTGTKQNPRPNRKCFRNQPAEDPPGLAALLGSKHNTVTLDSSLFGDFKYIGFLPG